MEEHPMYPPVKPARINEADHAIDSFKKIQEAALAIPADQVGRVTADVPVAASIALGTVHNLEQLRPSFESELKDGGAAVRALAELKHCALGALYAHVQSVAALSENELAKLEEDARPLRQNLLGSADSLANFGFFPPETIAAIREGRGTVDLAKDLIALAALFNSNWERVANKVPFDRELVTQASEVGTRLLRAVGIREVGEVRLNTSMDWAVLRARTFRLLVDTYEVLRRATTYVRWYSKDAAAFTPSLHEKTKTGNQGADDTPEPADPPAAQHAQASSSDQAMRGAETSPTTVIEPGLRGAPPFVK